LLDAGAQSLLISPWLKAADRRRNWWMLLHIRPTECAVWSRLLPVHHIFAAIGDCLTTARDEICLLAQVENKKGVDALDDILAVGCLDGVFIGPPNLAADMGFIGKLGQAEVKAAVLGRHQAGRRGGKVAGILTLDQTWQAQCRDLGATFIATETDVTLFARNMRASAIEAAKRFKLAILNGG